MLERNLILHGSTIALFYVKKGQKHMTDVIKFDDRKEWEKAVKKHARRIKDIVSHQVFGWNVGDNRDAFIVAVYLKGVEEGRKNSELILAELVKKYQVTEKTQ